MRQFLFRSTANIIGSLISANTSVGNAIASAIAHVFNAINQVLKTIAKSIMQSIDSERLDHIESLNEQASDLTELNLLMSATKVKEDALRNRAWTMMHTIAINRIGSALYRECGWEPPRIHGYLRQVIESIPGMVYAAGDDYEDDE